VIGVEVRLRQSLGPADEFASDRAAQTAFAQSMLRAQKGARHEVFEELAIDAAVAAHIPVVIRRTLPDADRREMRRLQRRHVPLVHRVIRNAVHADLAGAPILRRGPFDADVDVARLARRERIEITRRAAGAAGVDADNDVAVGHPLFGVDHLPVLIFVARSFRDLGESRNHAVPRIGITFLEGQPLAEGAVAQDDRITACPRRPENVGA
jgi:hypothetical protein